MKTLCAAIVVAILCLAGLAPAANVHYTFHSTGKYPEAGFTCPLALNSTLIVGEYQSASASDGYIETYATRQFSAIVPPGSHTAYASGINKQGIVVGGFCSSRGGCGGYPQSEHGFSYDHGAITVWY
jgi:hypothetical protein